MINYPDLLKNEYFGNPIYKYLLVFGVLIATLILGKILDFVLKKYLKKVIGRTKTKLDDIIIHSLEKPFLVFFFVIGLYVSSFFLNLSEAVVTISLRLIKSLLIFIVSWFLINVIDELIEQYLTPLVEKTESELDNHLIPLLRKLVKTTLILMAVIMILSDLGFNVTSILAGLGIGGLAFAFAAKDLLANIFGGIAIIFDKSFKISDKIKVSGAEGKVIQIGIRTTVLESPEGTKLIIPNSKIANNVIENKSFKPKKK